MKSIRSLFILLLVCCLFPGFACAQTEIVGQTHEDYIHRYTAPNGQQIYFLSREDAPFVREMDVNFDGKMDLVATVTLGASNFFCEFFVWDGAQYVLATNNAGITGGLPNHTLYPEKGLVHCEVNNGWAGLLGEDHIFRWQGTQLVQIRHSLSDHPRDMFSTPDDFFVDILDQGSVRFLVEEIVYGGLNPERKALFDATLTNDEAQQRDAEMLSAMRDALWQGL